VREQAVGPVDAADTISTHRRDDLGMEEPARDFMVFTGWMGRPRPAYFHGDG
jgi:hypothetical protein